MKKALIVGGASGLGLAIALKLSKLNYETIYIVDKNEPLLKIPNAIFLKKNLINNDYSEIKQLKDIIDTVIITAGIGKLNYFSEFENYEIDIQFKINTFPTLKIVNIFYDHLKSSENLDFVVVTSIAGIVSSPLYALYSSTKGALHKFIESINAELTYLGSNNKILEIAPGHINGTGFHGKKQDIESLEELVNQIMINMGKKQDIYIPKYENIYKSVISKYQDNPMMFGLDSINYKLQNAQLETTKKIKIGYLSGTFDLFHIGHLNLIKRAKEYCEYLIVGLHKDGSHKGVTTAISFNERKCIVESISYVDKVIESFAEDSDAYEILKYDYLFVGSDYKGTDRFNRYEQILTPKGVKIIYFPYTTMTSSTSLRNFLKNK